MIHEDNPRCPRCDSRLKVWSELNDDERIMFEKLPASAEYSLAQRKKHRICTRCWFEQAKQINNFA